jgi:uncharacterized protein (TIGR02145 family)
MINRISGFIILVFALLPKLNYAQVMPQGFLVGQVVETVTIGTQVWMKYNLDTEVYQDGTSIEGANIEFTRTLTTPSWCYYLRDESYNATYGKLYNGYAINNAKGVCPVGFKVPSSADFNTLSTYLGGNTIAGGKLKQAGLTTWTLTSSSVTNSSKFTGLPGGYMGDAGSSSNLGDQAYFWTSTSAGTTNYVRMLKNSTIDFTETTAFALKGGASVRCIKQ